MDEVIAALVAGGKSEDEAKAMVEGMSKAAEGKAASILASKKKEQERVSALESEKAELQAKIDELSSQGLSEVDKMQKQVELLTKRTEAAEAEKQSALQTMAQQARDAQIGALASGIRWMDSVDPALQKLIVANGLESVEDLGDEVSVSAALDAITGTHAKLIQSDAPNGTGQRQANPTPSGGQQSGSVQAFDIGSLKGSKTYEEKMAAIDSGWDAAEAQHTG
jgi:hypothetical protein